MSVTELQTNHGLIPVINKRIIVVNMLHQLLVLKFDILRSLDLVITKIVSSLLGGKTNIVEILPLTKNKNAVFIKY